MHSLSILYEMFYILIFPVYCFLFWLYYVHMHLEELKVINFCKISSFIKCLCLCWLVYLSYWPEFLLKPVLVDSRNLKIPCIENPFCLKGTTVLIWCKALKAYIEYDADMLIFITILIKLHNYHNVSRR